MENAAYFCYFLYNHFTSRIFQKLQLDHLDCIIKMINDIKRLLCPQLGILDENNKNKNLCNKKKDSTSKTILLRSNK